MHKNGVEGITKAIVMALDYKDTVSKYRTFLGQEPLSSSSNDIPKTTYGLKQTMIEVLRASENKLVMDQIRGKGIGIYGLQLIGTDFKPDQMDQSKLPGLALMDNKKGSVATL